MKPLILAFDLDHMLFEVKLDHTEKSTLSSSAGAYLGSGDHESVKNPVLKTDSITNEDLKAATIATINRQEMSEIFRKMQCILDTAKRQNATCPLAVKIITSSSYDKKYVLKLLDKFYFFSLPILQDDERFPIEYYNYDDLEDLTAIPTLPDFPTKSGMIDPRKEKLLSKMYPIWAQKMANLEKKRVILVDNADYNIAAVASKGFTGLHYPTTPNDRLDGITYTTHGKSCLNELHRLIDEVTVSLQKPESIKPASDNKPAWTVTQTSKLKFVFKRSPLPVELDV
jgi:hypothetical protein